MKYTILSVIIAIINLILPGSLQGKLLLIYETAELDLLRQEVFFTLIFNRPPMLYQQDGYGRQIDGFQYYISRDFRDTSMIKTADVIIRGDEIYITGNRIRIRQSLGPSGKSAGGWGPLVNQKGVPFALEGKVLKFSVSYDMLGINGNFKYRLETYETGSLSGLYIHRSRDMDLTPVNPNDITYFLAAQSGPQAKAFVLPLIREIDKKYARSLIINGNHGEPSGFMAKIGPANNNALNYNRDFLHPGAPTWNWVIADFMGFDYSGNMIDDPNLDLDHLLDHPTYPYITFKNYVIVREMGKSLEPWFCDISPNSRVDIEDFAVFSQNWLGQNCGFPDWCGGADINGDHRVNIRDLHRFSFYWLWKTGQ